MARSFAVAAIWSALNTSITVKAVRRSALADRGFTWPGPAGHGGERALTPPPWRSVRWLRRPPLASDDLDVRPEVRVHGPLSSPIAGLRVPHTPPTDLFARWAGCAAACFHSTVRMPAQPASAQRPDPADDPRGPVCAMASRRFGGGADAPAPLDEGAARQLLHSG